MEEIEKTKKGKEGKLVKERGQTTGGKRRE